MTPALTSPEKSYKTSAHSPTGSSFLRVGGGGAGGVDVTEADEEPEVTRLTGGGANCFLGPEDGGGKWDDGVAKGWSEFLDEFLMEVKNPLAEVTSTSPSVW